jgi:hypothetical protein
MLLLLRLLLIVAAVRDASSRSAVAAAAECWKRLAGDYRGSMGSGGEDAIVIKALVGGSSSPNATEAQYAASGYIWGKHHIYTFSAFPNETTSQCTDQWCQHCTEDRDHRSVQSFGSGVLRDSIWPHERLVP